MYKVKFLTHLAIKEGTFVQDLTYTISQELYNRLKDGDNNGRAILNLVSVVPSLKSQVDAANPQTDKPAETPAETPSTPVVQRGKLPGVRPVS